MCELRKRAKSSGCEDGICAVEVWLKDESVEVWCREVVEVVVEVW
jgi:hypothetical protein